MQYKAAKQIPALSDLPPTWIPLLHYSILVLQYFKRQTEKSMEMQLRTLDSPSTLRYTSPPSTPSTSWLSPLSPPLPPHLRLSTCLRTVRAAASSLLLGSWGIANNATIQVGCFTGSFQSSVKIFVVMYLLLNDDVSWFESGGMDFGTWFGDVRSPQRLSVYFLSIVAKPLSFWYQFNFW